MRRPLLTAAIVLLFSFSARGEDFINTDRPSFSNSTVIIPSGSLQLESGVSRQNSQDPSGTQTWQTQTPLLLRAGLSHNLEGRLNWNGYEWQTVGTDHTEGSGDLSAGVKWRHHEASGPWPAVASVVMVAFPSGASRVRTLGARPSWQLPLDWNLPGDNGLTLMPATTYDRSAEGRQFFSGTLSALVNHSWSSRVQTFVEYAGQQFAAPADGGTLETFDVGGSVALSPDWQLDGAVYLGLNRNSPSHYFTLGLSTRRLGLWH